MAVVVRHAYRFGPFELDVLASRLLREGEPLALTPKAFDTLRLLVERHGRLVEKGELMRQLWPDTFVEEANLTQHVFTLRKVLGEQPNGRPYIDTVPRRGYLFAAPVQEVVDPPPGGPSAPPPATRAWPPTLPQLILAVALVVAAAIGLWFLNQRPGTRTASSAPRTLAVLPFKALASSENDESLALGMADALITRLATVHGLIVRPTSSVMKYAQGGVDILAAGRQLQVDALVDGRFQLVGDRVRVTVQLMNLADGSSIWADAFDEPFKDVFAVQDRISQRVAEALVANLTPEDRGRLARRDTQNTEAYRLYVRGRYFWERRTSESLHKSLEYYGQAIALDPSYGLAYAGMADSYNILGNFGLLAPRDAYPKAKTAAQQALTLDAHLSQARIAVAFATYLYDRDWNAAESGFKRALAEAPNYGPGHQWYAVCLVSRGRFDEALAEIRRAVEVDPTSLVINAVEAWVSFLARRYDAAIADAKRTLEMDADFVLAYEYLALTYAAQGKYEEALMEMRRFKSYSPATYDRDVGVVGLGLARTGRLEDARRTLDDLKALTRERYVSPYSEALIRIGLGEKAQAIALLERAADERYPWAIHFNIDPLLDPVRDDPRFIALRRRIGLPAVPIPVGN